MFREGFSFQNSISLVVTQHNCLIHKNLNELREQMIHLADQEDDIIVKNLLKNFSQEDSRMSLFSRPVNEGIFENDLERKNILENINSSQFLDFSFTKDMNLSLPDDAKLLVNIIYDNLRENMTVLIQNNVTKKIREYINQRVTDNKKEVDSLVIKAMGYYNPFVLAFSRTQKKYGNNFNQDTEDDAVVQRNWSAIWAVGAGSMTMTAASILAAVSAPFSLALGAIIGGGVGIKSYFIKKDNWENEITLRIKEEKRKILANEFRDIAKNLRSSKFDVHMNSSIKKGKLTEKINLDVSIQDEICKFGKSIECIYRIKGQSNTQFLQDVWIPVFSRIEEDLKRYSSQSAENFYNGEVSGSMIDFSRKNFENLNQEIERDPFRIGLSIDGGGIRGIIPALYLEEIEDISRKPICELFDIVGGTSVGGILGLGIVAPNTYGRPLYKAKEFVDLFHRQGKTIFSTRASKVQDFIHNRTSYHWRAQYDPKPLEHILSQKFGEIPLSFSLKPIVIPAVQTKQIQDNSCIYLFDSRHAINYPVKNFYMKDVARATSAAPTYFPAAVVSPIPVEGFIPSQISCLPRNTRERIAANILSPLMVDESGSSPISFLDGGILTNNPSEHVYNKLCELYPGQKHVVVSFGTGCGSKSDLPKDAGNLALASPLIETLMSENEHRIDDGMKKNLGENYLRLQVDLGREVSLDNVSDPILAFLQERAEEKFNDIENLTRLLLINYDSWKELGGRNL